MKVPIRYKSSDRYNAGVDVVYDDESKLQYAPFVYASTDSGDNGGDGEDEEGEEEMIIYETTLNTSGKNPFFDSGITPADVLAQMLAGKCVGFHIPETVSYSVAEGVIVPTSVSAHSIDFTYKGENVHVAVNGIIDAYVDDQSNHICFSVYVQ